MDSPVAEVLCPQKRGVLSWGVENFLNILTVIPIFVLQSNPVNNFQITILNASFDTIKLTSYTCSNPFTALHAFHMVLWIVRLSFIDIINHCNCIFIQICITHNCPPFCHPCLTFSTHNALHNMRRHAAQPS